MSNKNELMNNHLINMYEHLMLNYFENRYTIDEIYNTMENLKERLDTKKITPDDCGFYMLKAYDCYEHILSCKKEL